MQDKASRPLIETLSMTLGKPYTDDPGTPQNIEIPLQVALPDGQVLYAAVALGGLPFHGQQQIAERIAAAWNAFAGVATSDISAPGQCLHQIQEPEADIWPCVNIDVDESGKITNAKLYSPGLPAGNHDVYPVRVPYMDEHTEAWRACVDELEKAVPGFMSLGNMNGIECAVSAIRGLSERAKHQEPAAAEQAAWHAGLDEGRAQAAPAAVAVPMADAWEQSATDTEQRTGGVGQDYNQGLAEGMRICAKDLRAALAATPAQSMVLPEPVAWLAHYEDREGNSKYYTSTHKDLAQENDTNGEPQSLFTEQQVRALLAQAATAAAPALPADGVQPVEQGEVLVTVSGFTGCGKSAIAGEIEILCRALGLQVQWPDGDSEKNMTHADWTEALEQYKPRVHIVEQNIPFASKKGLSK